MKKPKKAPRDFNQLAKLIVDMSTDESPPAPEPESTKNPHAVALSKLGASKGGKARAASLSAAKKKAIAKKAAAARWGKE